MSESLYANRVGKGTHRALDHAQALARRFRYVLPCDIEQFFPAIDHALLRATLARKIHDPSGRWLIDQIITSGQGVLTDAALDKVRLYLRLAVC